MKSALVPETDAARFDDINEIGEPESTRASKNFPPKKTLTVREPAELQEPPTFNSELRFLIDCEIG